MIQCPKMVPQNHTNKALILQTELCSRTMTEKAYFCGRMALWHQITRILSKVLDGRQGLAHAVQTVVVELRLRPGRAAWAQLENGHARGVIAQDKGWLRAGGMNRRTVCEIDASCAIAPSAFAPGWRNTLITLMPLRVCDSMLRMLSTVLEVTYTL